MAVSLIGQTAPPSAQACCLKPRKNDVWLADQGGAQGMRFAGKAIMGENSCRV
jgi:hypothetical protein